MPEIAVQDIEPRARYLAYLADRARTSRQAWWLHSQRTGTDEGRREKLGATLRFFGQEHWLEDMDARLRSEPPAIELSESLREIIEQIATDLAEEAAPADSDVYRKTTFGLLPLGGVDAFCVDRTLWKVRLDGYLVIMNEGLFVCAQLLAKAFLLENLGGDLLQYKRPGAPIRAAAIQHFISPTSKSAALVMFEHVPPEVDGIFSAAQMSMTVLLLQFVLLHEIGHIVNRDFELMGKYQFHIAAESDAKVEPTQQHWSAEYAADGYALAEICGRAGSDMSRWANFTVILIFFDWLRSVEDAIGGPLCPLHPPPQLRAERLMSQMQANVPLGNDIYEQVRSAQEIIASWRDAG